MKAETTKQKKVAKVIQMTLSEILQQEFFELNKILISIPIVKVTSDLKSAKVYVSVFPDQQMDEVMVFLEVNHSKIKGYLGQRMRNQMRAIPEIVFFQDDSESELRRIDQLMKKLDENNKQMADIQQQNSENPSEDHLNI